MFLSHFYLKQLRILQLCCGKIEPQIAPLEDSKQFTHSCGKFHTTFQSSSYAVSKLETKPSKLLQRWSDSRLKEIRFILGFTRAFPPKLWVGINFSWAADACSKLFCRLGERQAISNNLCHEQKHILSFL